MTLVALSLAAVLTLPNAQIVALDGPPFEVPMETNDPSFFDDGASRRPSPFLRTWGMAVGAGLASGAYVVAVLAAVASLPLVFAFAPAAAALVLLPAAGIIGVFVAGTLGVFWFSDRSALVPAVLTAAIVVAAIVLPVLYLGAVTAGLRIAFPGTDCFPCVPADYAIGPLAALTAAAYLAAPLGVAGASVSIVATLDATTIEEDLDLEE